MEAGDPVIYKVLNLAGRCNDLTHIHTLGPYYYALTLVTCRAEEGRAEEDNIITDYDFRYRVKHLGYYSESTLYFRGGPMDPDWIVPFNKSADHRPTGLTIHGHILDNTTRSLQMAL